MRKLVIGLDVLNPQRMDQNGFDEPFCCNLQSLSFENIHLPNENPVDTYNSQSEISQYLWFSFNEVLRNFDFRGSAGRILV